MNNINIHPLSIINNIEQISFGNDVAIDPYTFFSVSGTLTIGNNVHISCFSSITGGENITIGDFVTVSMGCHIFSGSDDFKEEFFGNPTTSAKYRKIKRAPITLSKFVRIGANSTIPPGIFIAEGCSIGAGSVITKSITKPWSICIGNKLIGKRPKDKIMELYKQFLEEKEK